MDWEGVLHFWFRESKLSQWFTPSAEFDALVRSRFQAIHGRVCAGEMEDWRASAQGRLAEIIVLDQMSRNIFRGTPQAYQQDSMALALAQEAVRAGADRELSVLERQFLYMPYMHSESRSVHERAVVLYSQSGTRGALKHEIRHKNIIDMFGRYPHRNAVLGRASTPAEAAFLKEHPGI